MYPFFKGKEEKNTRLNGWHKVAVKWLEITLCKILGTSQKWVMVAVVVLWTVPSAVITN